MEKICKFATIDGSMSNTGIVLGNLLIDSDEKIVIQPKYSKLIETKPRAHKQTRASSDTIDRCRSLYLGTSSFVNSWGPDVIFAETPSGSQSANGMKSYGIVSMLIATLYPYAIEITPQHVKKAVTGKLSASKEEIRRWAYELYPDLNWLERNGRKLNKNEHCADALGAVHAGLETREWNQLLPILKMKMLERSAE